MRIRYGKPIKVKSLFGLQNIQSSNVSNVNRYFRMIISTNTFEGGSGIYNYSSYKGDIISNEDYLFLVVETTIAASNFGTCYFTQNTSTNYTSMTEYKSGNIIVIKQKLSTSSSATDSYHFRLSQPIKVDYKINYAFLLNASELGIDNLTAEQFYKKYNTNFSLIATGEEITIDDKAGQIAYEDLNDNVIRCKVAGGSSDIYYGYNNVFCCDNFSGNNIGNGTVTFDNGVYTYTFGSNIANTAYTNIVLDSTCKLIEGHKYLFIFKIKAPHTGSFYTRGFQTYNVTEANTWQDFTCIKTASAQASPSFYVSPNTPSSHGYQEGESYQVIIGIIDLTWWFGEGKEPTTVQEFKDRFTEDYFGACITAIKLTKYQIDALPNYGYNQVCDNGDFHSSTLHIGTVQQSMSITDHIAEITIGENKTSVFSAMYHTAVPSIINHKYYLKYDCKSASAGSFGFSTGIGSMGVSLTANGNWQVCEGITTATATQNNNIYIRFTPNGTMTSGSKLYFRYIMAIDLTEWFGAGNEPTTVEEFRQKFPNNYYPYSKERILNKYMINKLID